MRIRNLTTILGLLTLLAATPAWGASSFNHAIKVDGGIFSATGVAGVGYIHAPTNWLMLEGAVGYGVTGLQLSVMPKLALGSVNDRFVAGAGVALAVPVDGETENPGLWLNLDALGYEHRFDFGLSVSVAVGFTVGLAGADNTLGCFDGCDPTPITGQVLPQGRLSIGYWF